MKAKQSEEFEKLIDPNKYQVFLLACPAHLPVSFAPHPWFVLNKKGVVSRFEIVYRKCEHREARFGYIHLDALPPFKGISIFPLWEKIFWKAKVLSTVEGDLAEKLISVIEQSKNTYPYRDTYSLRGPNSNTYIQWVLDQFPEWNAQLPWNAFGKKYKQNKKIPIGVVHGRFQPPHNGHIRYLLAAFARAEHVIIGICTPEVCTEEEAERTGYPCAPRLNPFTHTEREEMLRGALSEAGIPKDRYSFVNFPSNYKNIDILLPKDSVFLMSTTGEGDTKKIEHIQSLGFSVETIFSVPAGDYRERSGIVRESAHTGDEWKNIVPASVSRYIQEHNIKERLARLANGETVLK